MTVDRHVEVAADEIDVEADHMRVQALQQGHGGVTFLGHVVQVDWTPKVCLRNIPRTSSDTEPNVVLLVECSTIGNVKASARNVFGLSSMARPSILVCVCVWHWCRTFGPWSCASCSMMALNGPHMAGKISVGRLRGQPGFHRSSGKRYCECIMSLTGLCEWDVELPFLTSVWPDQ